MVTDERIEKLLKTIAKRQWDVTVILENVHDPHNLGAVMRSCETVGITEVYILYTEETKNAERYIGRNASGGVSKWIKPHFYSDLIECFTEVKSKYKKIFATHLYEDSVSIYKKNLDSSMALLFGNERIGISKEALALTDGNIMIPMQGLAESLNVSVACSIMLYEMMRQRIDLGFYDREFDLQDQKSNALLHSFLSSTQPRIYEKNSKILYDLVLNYLDKKSNI